MQKPLVSIIIVNWNGRKFLEDCLGSLSRISYKNVEILFVDNASTDGSLDFVKKNYSKILLIENQKNLGFAEGHEAAFKKAKGETILLLNTDTIVEGDFLSKLVEALCKENDIGAVAPKVLMYPQTNSIDSIGSFFTLTGILYHYGRGKNPKLAQYNKEMEIYSAKGVCILFKKHILEKIGLFDKDYFAYFEETDLCHRIWLSGYRVIYVPQATVYHKGGGAASQMYSYILFHSYKNRICTYIKNLSLSYLLRVLPITIVFYLCACVFYTLTGKISLAWAVMKAFIWNINNLPNTLKKRQIIQEKIRVKRDSDFLPNITRSVGLSYYVAIYFNRVPKYKD